MAITSKKQSVPCPLSLNSHLFVPVNPTKLIHRLGPPALTTMNWPHHLHVTATMEMEGLDNHSSGLVVSKICNIAMFFFGGVAVGKLQAEQADNRTS
jgi:hypothetical protein